MDPATLIVIMTLASGVERTFTEEFKDVRECEERADYLRSRQRPSDQLHITCKKYLKIAPASSDVGRP